jgi:hypothetical protein
MSQDTAETATSAVVAAKEPVATSKVAKEVPAPKEKVFNVDVLSTCTARFDRQGWDLFLSWREDLAKIQTARISVELTARTPAGAVEIAHAMREADIPAVKQTGDKVTTLTTFAGLQLVIRHPQVLMAIVRPAQSDTVSR